MVNLPPQLVPNLHESLLDDISWAAENAEGSEDEMDAAIEQFVFCAPFAVVEPDAVGHMKGKKPEKREPRVATSGGSSGPPMSSSSMLFDRFDDDLLTQKAYKTFSFEIGWRRFIVGAIKVEHYRQCIKQMKALF